MALCRAYDVALTTQAPFPSQRILLAVDVSKQNKDKPVSGGMVGMTAEAGIALMLSILMNACSPPAEAAAEGTTTTTKRGYDVVAFSRREVAAVGSPSKRRVNGETGEGEKETVNVAHFPPMDVTPSASPAEIVKTMGPILSFDVDVASLLDHCQVGEEGVL